MCATWLGDGLGVRRNPPLPTPYPVPLTPLHRRGGAAPPPTALSPHGPQEIPVFAPSEGGGSPGHLLALATPRQGPDARSHSWLPSCTVGQEA